ncbi:hypothetical protein CFIMG_005211RA [Ceratocystis fimbriata CBS 114723]|uniref:Uncharacterized protein n=1 Tax=Ceratocystis fimbriata CBS 114723 TaxID=1035309 RepID=A0A2C5X071_9PEZI|nr:hypothetical protein CFIMG_005211RA [Ceratocystis fimbriata CBS 114723]
MSKKNNEGPSALANLPQQPPGSDNPIKDVITELAGLILAWPELVIVAAPKLVGHSVGLSAIQPL